MKVRMFILLFIIILLTNCATQKPFGGYLYTNNLEYNINKIAFLGFVPFEQSMSDDAIRYSSDNLLNSLFYQDLKLDKSSLKIIPPDSIYNRFKTHENEDILYNNLKKIISSSYKVTDGPYSSIHFIEGKFDSSKIYMREIANFIKEDFIGFSVFSSNLMQKTYQSTLKSSRSIYISSWIDFFIIDSDCNILWRTRHATSSCEANIGSRALIPYFKNIDDDFGKSNYSINRFTTFPLLIRRLTKKFLEKNIEILTSDEDSFIWEKKVPFVLLKDGNYKLYFDPQMAINATIIPSKVQFYSEENDLIREVEAKKSSLKISKEIMSKLLVNSNYFKIKILYSENISPFYLYLLK